MKYAWKLWAKALGEKATATDRDADIVASIRTAILLVNFTTCIFIILNIVRHWQ
jgi:hypothetical protein